MKLDITQDEREMLSFGLNMRIAYIETGNPILRASQAIAMGDHKLVKRLTVEQRQLIARIEELQTKLLMAR